ncbi:MAG: Sec-independent protein translocase subunit TatA [Pseudonocardiales bacterium]|nr:Sec-independent protein translocase subunit TatA [Pseudonocardiales bacterium]MBV9029277.1 Sec-independent protein translocase subunit TatA [Pseudonocardiales bacterium]
MGGLTGWHLLIILAVFVLLFGAKRLPDMARAVGQSARIFKGEMKGAAAEEHPRSPQQAPAASPAIEEHPHPVAPDHLTPDRATPTHQPTPGTTQPPTL